MAGSSNLLPMSLLVAKRVFSGFVTAYIILNIQELSRLGTYLSLSWDTNESLTIFSEGNGGGSSSHTYDTAN